jgi:hypothetical protein
MQAHRGKRISDAQFRRWWDDPALTLGEIGARLGVSSKAVSQRAAVRGFPQRVGGRCRIYDAARIVALYRLGLSERAVAAVMGCSRCAVQGALNAAGVVRRVRGVPSPLRPEAAREALVALAMRGAARETRAAMRDAEMIDRASPKRRVAA